MLRSLCVCMLAITLQVSISVRCQADQGFVFSYADENGWAAQYLLDGNLQVQAVRYSVLVPSGKPNPDDDDGPVGPWVHVALAESVYGKFTSILRPNPEDDDDNPPWGPVGRFNGSLREVAVMGAYNAMFLPNPEEPDPPFPWPWRVGKHWVFETESAVGSFGQATFTEVDIRKILKVLGPDPTPWVEFEPDPEAWQR
ncbi:MAG: hypothetical protein R3C53_08445 [Pirellulaceae bacterium]